MSTIAEKKIHFRCTCFIPAVDTVAQVVGWKSKAIAQFVMRSDLLDLDLRRFDRTHVAKVALRHAGNQWVTSMGRNSHKGLNVHCSR